jgi:hypothetical protein
MINRVRNQKGAVPIHIPLLLFLYTMVFLIGLEFVMLFWLNNSLNNAASQMAKAAATNTNLPVTDVRGRCLQAAQGLNTIGPGYSIRVKEDFIQGLQGGMKNYSISDLAFNENSTEKTLRNHLATMGAARPNGFWTGAGSNAQFGGCFAVRNPVTKQINYHVVIHSGCTWPVMTRGLFSAFRRMSNAADVQRTAGFCGWLEGKGVFGAKASGLDTEGIGRALYAAGVRPCVFCTNSTCDHERQNDQTRILPNNVSADGLITGATGVARPFAEYSPNNPNRPRANTVAVGSGKRVYAIDQWPQARGGFCERCGDNGPKPCPAYNTVSPSMPSHQYCKGEDKKPAGIQTIANCGDIDPLILVGLRYACQGQSFPDGQIIPTKVLGRCDHYFKVLPCGAQKPVEMPHVAGDVTDLDGKGNPIIIRKTAGACTKTQAVCRTDSVEVKPWVGPFHAIGVNSDGDPEQMHEKIREDYNKVDKDKGALANPLDQLIPYNQFCDVCNPGSPRCGYFGTCRNTDTYWKEAKVVLRGQWWTNTSFYELNPMYFELECKYRRDCQLQHCCWGVWHNERQKLVDYCAQRAIGRQQGERSPKCGKNKYNTWYFKGVPNAEAQGHSATTLPRDGGFPLCSEDSVKKGPNRTGECCAVDVDMSRSRIRCPQFKPRSPSPSDLVPAKPCLSCKPGDLKCKIRCNKDKHYKGGFCPNAECFRLNGRCIITRKLCLYGKNCKIQTTSTTTTTTTSGWIITTSGIDTCYYNCGPGAKPGPTGPGTTPSSSGETSSSSSSGDCEKQCQLYYSPLIISLDSSELQQSANKVDFALNPNSVASSAYAWLKASNKQGFVALDFNHNGIIDDGSELMGNYTNNKSYKNAYAALAGELDINHDGLINGEELQALVLWQDLNEDGISQADEIKPLSTLGVTEINTGSNLETGKISIGSDSYATPYSNAGIKSVIDGKEVVGKSWDVWLKQYHLANHKPSAQTVSLWDQLGKLFVSLKDSLLRKV